MVARYGDRTRVSSQVSTWGKDVEGGAALPEEFVETFTAPGTWTWPGKVDSVTVTVVGGGGGSGAGTFGPGRTPGAAGGGGGVRLETVPVTGPVPVVVGAGGAAGITPTPNPNLIPGQVGGDSSFGSITVGGGAGGVRDNPSPTGLAGFNAPANGGGGSGATATPRQEGLGGAYGYPARQELAGGTNSQAKWTGPNFQAGNAWLGYGSAGRTARDLNPLAPNTVRNVQIKMGNGFDTPYGSVKPNSGNGAPYNEVNPVAGNYPGFAGGSGVVIVRYWQ